MELPVVESDVDMEADGSSGDMSGMEGEIGADGGAESGRLEVERLQEELWKAQEQIVTEGGGDLCSRRIRERGSD